METQEYILNDLVKLIPKQLSKISELHKKVSAIKTPESEIQQPTENYPYEYVKLGYMKRIADKEYPGWSFTIIDEKILFRTVAMPVEKITRDPQGMVTSKVTDFIPVEVMIANKVHGRLKWYDCGLWREGDINSAHRIQLLKDKSGYVDLGNDIKASGTDTLKKAFNTYLNIADDVYRNLDPELTKQQIDELTKYAVLADITETISDRIDDGKITSMNYKGSLARLKRLAEEKEKQ